MNPNEIRQCLEELAVSYPKVVMSKLEKGSVVQKSMGLSYEIDDTDIYKKLGDFPEGAVPYGPAHRALESSLGKLFTLFNGRERIPFSEAFNAKLGECLEKAILVQLSAQKGEASYLINGVLEEENVVGAGGHAFNIVYRNGNPYLVDAENPLRKDETGKITNPYIAPLIGIDEKTGQFIVPDEWKQGRRYYLW